MNWKLIPKKNSKQPSKGRYPEWKPLLAKEGFYQCVYCAIPDSKSSFSTSGSPSRKDGTLRTLFNLKSCSVSTEIASFVLKLVTTC